MSSLFSFMFADESVRLLGHDPSVIEFCKNHGLDVSPSGSSRNDLIIAICEAINKLEAKK